MFAGHIGAALALGRVERRINVGVFVAATLLLDIVLWLLVLLGWESVSIPENFSATHQPNFVFPYSHGLLASLAWSGLAAVAGLVAYARFSPSRWRVAALLAAAVFSHWLLDAIVHQPELVLVSASSPKVGLGLWHNMPVALVVEAAIVVFGLFLFVPGAGLSRGKGFALSAVILTVLGLTAVGMTVAPPPPSAQAMAASSLVTLAVVVGLVGWLVRRSGGRA